MWEFVNLMSCLAHFFRLPRLDRKGIWTKVIIIADLCLLKRKN